MKTFNVIQYSDDWWTGTAGRGTVSELTRIIIPSTLKESKSIKPYAAEVAASRIIGRRDEGDFKSVWMERGSIMEEEARDFYSMKKGVDIAEVGYITSDDGKLGASPDGLIMGTSIAGTPVPLGGVEIKCPKPGTLVSMWIEGKGKKVPLQYQLQVAGSLYISQFEYWDFLAYCPGMKPYLVRTTYEDAAKQIEAIKVAVPKFDDLVTELVAEYWKSTDE